MLIFYNNVRLHDIKNDMKVILDINYGNESAVEMIIAMTNECDNNNCYEIRNVITEKTILAMLKILLSLLSRNHRYCDKNKKPSLFYYKAP